MPVDVEVSATAASRHHLNLIGISPPSSNVMPQYFNGWLLSTIAELMNFIEVRT
jgi:hypothetical protein